MELILTIWMELVLPTAFTTYVFVPTAFTAYVYMPTAVTTYGQ